VHEVARGYSNLEFDLDRGARGSRQDHAVDILRRLTGAESALVVNNNAGAVLLALAALAEGREVVVSRGELIEIGDGFRIPDVLARSGARLVEVGTTNRTRADDYERAIGPDTAVLLRVHQSNFRVVGFAERPEASQLAELAALGGTLMLYLDPQRALREVPALRMVAEPAADVHARAERLAELTGGTVEETVARVGGGALPLAELPSFACALEEGIAEPLRQGEPPVVGVLRDGRLLLDCRALADQELDEVAAAVTRARG
jgi:seryl-tRNA(Sec) selenium transferase